MAQGVTVTWLGHGTFLYEGANGERLLVDPWIEGNPKFPDDWKAKLGERLDAILLTHGHFDHVGGLDAVAKESGAPVLCIFDMVGWLTQQGLDGDRLTGFNLGGTTTVANVVVTMVQAMHSSSHTDAKGTITYLGQAVGYVLEWSDGTVIYHAGDTAVFGDMQLIGEIYRPDAAVLPIGDFFTMGPRQAAHAARLIGAPRIIPGHWGTFPLLPGTPTALRDALGETEVEVVALEPGDSTTVTHA